MNNVAILTALIKHLPGKHDQDTHGNRDGLHDDPNVEVVRRQSISHFKKNARKYLRFFKSIDDRVVAIGLSGSVLEPDRFDYDSDDVVAIVGSNGLSRNEMQDVFNKVSDEDPFEGTPGDRLP